MEITNSVDRGMDGCFSFEGPTETAQQMADDARTMEGNGAQLDSSLSVSSGKEQEMKGDQ